MLDNKLLSARSRVAFTNTNLTKKASKKEGAKNPDKPQLMEPTGASRWGIY